MQFACNLAHIAALSSEFTVKKKCSGQNTAAATCATALNMNLVHQNSDIHIYLLVLFFTVNF